MKMRYSNDPKPAPERTKRLGFWVRAIELRKHELTREYRRGLTDRAREGVSDEDYATTLATLETMARNLGWTEEQGAGPRRGFRGHGRFGHEHGHHDHDHGHHDHDHDGQDQSGHDGHHHDAGVHPATMRGFRGRMPHPRHDLPKNDLPADGPAA